MARELFLRIVAWVCGPLNLVGFIVHSLKGNFWRMAVSVLGFCLAIVCYILANIIKKDEYYEKIQEKLRWKYGNTH